METKSNLDTGDSMESHYDHVSDSEDPLVESEEEEAGIAAPLTTLALTAVATHAIDIRRSYLPSFENLYREPLAVRGVSPSTVKDFNGLLLYWVRFCKEIAKRVSDMDPDTMDARSE